MMRNSTQGLEHRELLGGAKQWKENVELASELLPQIVCIQLRVGADGVHRYLERI